MQSKLLHRILVFAAYLGLMFWIGGLTFYAGIVVPEGTRQFGVTEQGFVTQQVTLRLNQIGWATLAILAAELLVRQRRRWWISWLIMGVAQVVLVVVHVRLSGMLDGTTRQVTDQDRFYGVHRIYLLATTAIWIAALAHTWGLTRVSPPSNPTPGEPEPQ